MAVLEEVSRLLHSLVPHGVGTSIDEVLVIAERVLGQRFSR